MVGFGWAVDGGRWAVSGLGEGGGGRWAGWEREACGETGGDMA